MDFTITEILLGIITIAISIIAVKITFSFNLNEYFKNRDEKLESKIKNYCTHSRVNNIDNGISLQSSFISPSGTTSYICQKCNLQLYHLDYEQESMRLEELLKDPKEFEKKEKKFKKLLKKAGYL